MKEILSFSLSLAPGAYVWWVGRRLVRHLDDPAFPELHFARTQRTGIVIGVCLVLSLALSLSLAPLKVALVVLGVLAARFPARKRIYGEGWGLLAYLVHTLRFWLAVLGAWILIALIPALALSANGATLPVLVLAAALAMAWSHFGAYIIARVTGATEIQDAELETRFDQILERARCARPRLLELAARGGYWVNAFALPSPREPAVLFTADLLDSLTPAETAGIFAHEVAHLEYFDRRRLLQRELLLGALLLALVIFFAWAGSDRGLLTITAWVWPLLILVLLAGFVAGSQAREHQSDLRALELLGDAEALISGLTKIHNLMRLPRRWAAGREGSLSHPSLAHRLRAIREAAWPGGVEELEPAGPMAGSPDELVVRGADTPTEVVVFTADRLYWLRGVDLHAPDRPVADLMTAARDYRSIRYDDLSDLRLDISGLRRRYLKAVDARGQEQKLALAAEDVERVKRALERFDSAVRGTSPEASRQLARTATRRRLSRIWGLLAAIVGLLPPLSLPLSVFAVLLALRPARVTLATAGAVAIGAGALGLRSASSFLFAGTPLVLVVLLEIALGLLILLELRTWRRQAIGEPSDAATWTLSLLAVLTGLYLLSGLGGLTSAPITTQLHLWARHDAGLAASLVGFGAALLALHVRAAPRARTLRARLSRPLAAVAFAAIGLLVLVGSEWFNDRWGDDPLAGSAPAFAHDRVALEKVREVRLNGRPFDLRLSPAGGRLAARIAPVAPGGTATFAGAFLVEVKDDRWAPLHASDLAFLDEDRIAALFYAESGELELAILRASDPRDRLETRTLPVLIDPRLRLDRRAGGWEVVGTDLERGSATLLSGSWADSQFVRVERTFEESEDAYLTDLKLNASGEGLAVSSAYAGPAFGNLTLALVGLSGYGSMTRLWRVSESGSRLLARTTLQVWCLEPGGGASEYLCLGHGREGNTRLLAIDPSHSMPLVLGVLPGSYYQGGLADAGRLILSGYATPPLQIDPRGGRAWSLGLHGPADAAALSSAASGLSGWLARLMGTDGGDSVEPDYAFYDVGFAAGALAAAIPDGQGSRVEVYRLPGERR